MPETNMRHQIRPLPNQKIWLARPEILGNEMEYVKQSFEDGWITTAYKDDSFIGKFERSVRDFLGEGYPVALQSGTAAIHMALNLAGVQPGDMVFCSDLTFAASANPIRYLGAEPVFIDSEPTTYNMDPEALRKAFECGLRPKAVVVVHVYGLPADTERILQICNEYSVPVIEDATESLGATVWKKKTGTIGRFGCLSFNGNKMITAGGTGGMLVCQNEDDAKRAAFLAAQAKEAVPWYEHKELGYNYRLANSNAAFGYGQMEHIYERMEKKRSIYDAYDAAFREHADIIRMYPIGNESTKLFGNAWLSCIEINPATGVKPAMVMERLAEWNVEARRIWKPLHRQPVYEGSRFFSTVDGFISMSEYAFLTGLCLPSDTKMTLDEVESVADKVLKILGV